MLFYIAAALDDPFGFDSHDLKLNLLACKACLQLLTIYASQNISLKTLIRSNHETPAWLENPAHTSHANLDRYQFEHSSSPLARLKDSLYNAFFRIPTLRLFLPMLLFTLWSAFVVVGSYFIAREDDSYPQCRWRCLYIPIDTNVTAYISLAVFLVLAFWLNDTYGRYWSALQIWQTEITPRIEEAASQLALYCKSDFCHARDRERLFSFFVALPIAGKLFLRNSKDFSELQEILDPEDLKAISASPNPVQYCVHVICAYWSSMESSDPETNQSKISPFGAVVYNNTYLIWGLEKCFSRCKFIKDYQLPEPFTLHLQIFSAIWLILLPLSIVEFYGFISFAVLIPVGYSIITLLLMGTEFSDPFGYDTHDIPMDRFCHSIKDSLHRTYQIHSRDLTHLVHDSDYPLQRFSPADIRRDSALETKVDTPTPMSFFRKLVEIIPSVPLVPFLLSSAWTVAAVFISERLSRVWSSEKRDACAAWCSPIDVDSGTFGNIGFALFLILAFRAGDAIYRYDSGANMLHRLKALLRSLVTEFCFEIKDGVMHDAEKKRFVAHVVQVPLYLRDVLLGKSTTLGTTETLLSEDDFNEFIRDSDPLGYLLDTIRSYVLMPDMQDQSRTVLLSANPCPGFVSAVMMGKPFAIRSVISEILACKRYPVVSSYTSHQQVFTALWLFLLPLNMSSTTGYYTILWAPIISFGVLALENIAVKLVDPFGSDDIDIPVEAMCNEASTDIITTVLDCKWDTTEYTASEGVPSEAFSAANVLSGGLGQAKSLPYCDYSDATMTTAIDPTSLHFKGRDRDKMEPSSFVHFLHSVPWRALVAITAWSAVACLISYFARKDVENERWWISAIVVNSDVAVYFSFAGKACKLAECFSFFFLIFFHFELIRLVLTKNYYCFFPGVCR